MGSFGSAIWSIERVLEDRPDDADAHNRLGAICGQACPEYQQLRTATRRRGSGAG